MAAIDVETAVGLPEILKVLQTSKSKFHAKLRGELQDAGVIFYMRQWRLGRDGKKRLVKICYAFPSRIQKWIAVKASKREML